MNSGEVKAGWFFLGLVLGLPVSDAQAVTLSTLASLTPSSGDHPYAAILFDNVVGRESQMYTTTAGGGAGYCYLAARSGCGSIVMLTPPASAGGQWVSQVLRVFADPDGSVPYSGLIMDTRGALYGTTTRGGTGFCTFNAGCGIVFKLQPPTAPGAPWTETVLHAFTNPPDGRSPGGNLVFDTFGALYGTAATGGQFSAGVVFKLTPPAKPNGAWTETILHTFTVHDGARPRANLIFDTNGALYGTTQFGGAANLGTVFKLAPPSSPGGAWTETVLRSFAGPDGDQPFNALQFDSNGALYGTCWKGGPYKNAGTVFKLVPPTTPGGPWGESVYQMMGHADGSTMQGGLVRDTFGVFFGTTNGGGTTLACPNGDCGTVFRITQPSSPGGYWTHTVLAVFNGPNGGDPEITPTFFQGNLYGTSDFGGSANLGTVFELAP